MLRSYWANRGVYIHVVQVRITTPSAPRILRTVYSGTGPKVREKSHSRLTVQAKRAVALSGWKRVITSADLRGGDDVSACVQAISP